MTLRKLPIYAWAGAIAMAVSEAGMLARLPPFYHWHTPIAWSGYILFADGLLWKRRGASWVRNARAELVFLALVSVPLWVIFELYNKCCLENWYYVGLPDAIPLRYFGYAWSFATIWPAIFITGDLVSAIRDRRAPHTRADLHRREPLGAVGLVSVIVGALMLAVPLIVPSPYLAAPVWLGFFFLLDPLNARAGDESILGDLREQRRDRLINLAVAGLVCGVLWEFWNYWAIAKWHYTVPIMEDLKLFEMPVPGYLGFPAFALECFAMYVFVRRLIWRGAERPISV